MSAATTRLRGATLPPVVTMSASTMPADLQSVLDQIETSDRGAEALASPLTDQQFFWQPDGGRSWSIAQCLDHLATANEVYGSAMTVGIEGARLQGWKRRGPIRSTLPGRWFVNSMEPPVRRKTRAPGKIRPAPSRSRPEIMRRFHDSNARIVLLIRTSADLDVNRATFANPFLPLVRVRVGTAFRIIAAHNRRHLWQAQRVTTAEGYPR